jgi:putative acetyltransferase
MDELMEIRRYLQGEESAIWQVVFAATHESIARDYHANLVERWAPLDQDMSAWSARLAQTLPFVALAQGETIVGMAEVDGQGFIDYFYVHPQWQHQGIGSALLATLETEAARLNQVALEADVSITAKTFFLAHGFSILEEKAGVILGHPAPNFHMRKALLH